MLHHGKGQQPHFDYPEYLDESYSRNWAISKGFGILQGLAGGADWQEIQEEVSHEMEGHVALVGIPGAGKRSLLAQLRGQPLTAAADDDILCDGFFLLINVAITHDDVEREFIFDYLQTVDLILYMIDGEKGVQPPDITWISLLRSRGMRVLGVLNKADRLSKPRQKAVQMGAKLGMRLTPISAIGENLAETQSLVEQILKVRPGLAIPLAREAPLARGMVTERLIRQSVLTAAMLGASPAPLLDLPFQVSNHARMALRIGAAYGQPGADYLSREMMAAVGTSIGLRYLIQQIIRLVPVIGWVVNAIINASSTYLLGRMLVAYYRSNWDVMSSKEILEATNPLPKIVQGISLPPVPWPSNLQESRFLTLLSSKWHGHLLRFKSVFRGDGFRSNYDEDS